MTSRTLRAALSLISFGLGAGCGPGPGQAPPSDEAEAFAAAVCSSRSACGCADGRFESPDACADHWQDLFAAAQSDERYAFDPECLDTLLSSALVTSCEPWPPATFDYQCAVFQGSAKEGEPCTNRFDLYPAIAYECGPGLSCHAGRCRAEAPLPSGPQPGDPCRQDDILPCETDMFCSAEAGDTCQVHAELGQPCADRLECGVEGYCEGLGLDGLGVCAPMKDLSDDCDPLDWRACGLAWCDPSGVCVEDQPAICHMTHTLAFQD